MSSFVVLESLLQEKHRSTGFFNDVQPVADIMRSVSFPFHLILCDCTDGNQQFKVIFYFLLNAYTCKAFCCLQAQQGHFVFLVQKYLQLKM